ncbi:MAG: CDP-glycerol glycerophosphotransferase family protein [Treponema sp.]|jgi:hypothetical protein|nr:CDP-glycerol glycerophosphotransferase family protein [Treponema sp.]
MLLLYIDPGTGSALFSILIGAAATLYFLGRALLIRLKVLLSGGKAKFIAAHPIVIYSEGPQYWNLFRPVLDELEAREKKALFLTSAADDPVFDAAYRHIKSEYIGEGNRAYGRLNMMQAVVCMMTTPGLDVYQLKRSRLVGRYVHLLHALTDPAMYRLFSLDYFDTVLLTGDYQIRDTRRLERLRQLPEKELITVGCTYLDEFAAELKKLPPREAVSPEQNGLFTVLVSPSWGPQALLSRFGERLLDPLAASGWNIIVRPHPHSKKVEGAAIEKLRERYRDNGRIRWDYERENIHALSRADIMISDFSGIIFDYSFLFDRPVIYVRQGMDLRPYDADDLGGRALDELWQFRSLKKFGVELKEENLADIVCLVKEAANNAGLREARQEAGEESWQHRGEAAKRIADYLVEICKEFSAET